MLSERAYHGTVRVEATDRAAAIVRRVIDAGRANLVMVLGNGCCDSTAPYLYDHYVVEPGAQRVGAIEGIDVLAPEWIARLYPGEERLTVDVREDEPDDSFSLETEFDCRFVLRADG